MDTENEVSDNDVLSTYKNNIAYVILPSSTTRSNRRSMGWSNLFVGYHYLQNVRKAYANVINDFTTFFEPIPPINIITNETIPAIYSITY